MARYVKYVGTSGQRIITAADWKRAGLEGQKPVSWDRRNGWTVDIEPLSDEAQVAIMAEAEMVEVSDAVAEMEKDAARRMPRDQRTRTKEQRERVEEAKPVVNAQTSESGVTTTDKGETTTESGTSTKKSK